VSRSQLPVALRAAATTAPVSASRGDRTIHRPGKDR
jgi:hypothetical protein